ncbi:protein yellow-like, partial [Ctenocephalides felis]|uniref:protein yellow-like n=1 Tax=Ctenocephalides felis TaxID=7515 RepID=UPI000E6E4ED7
WKSGVASTLNYVNLTEALDNKSPDLVPYPNWEANKLPSSGQGDDTTPSSGESSSNGLVDNSTIISTFRVRVDECDRLWVMDCGLVDILGTPKVYAKPALLIFDLHTDQLIKRYTFEPTDLKEDSFFANVVVDVRPDACDDAFAYIPDLGAYGVVVYSFRDDDSWRVSHNYFHFEPLAGEYDIAGVQFQWTDGVFGIALSKHQPDGYRTAYFHAMSSTKEFAVSTRLLQNSTWAHSPEAYHEFKLVGDRGPKGQSSASFLHENSGVLFYTQVNKDGIACWNSGKPYNEFTQGVVAQDPYKLVFPNDLKVDYEDNVWVLSDRMPLFIYRDINPAEVNYRILKVSVKDAVVGTPCA